MSKRFYLSCSALLALFALLPFGFLLSGTSAPPLAVGVESLAVQVVQEYPHDSSAYTQGLVYAEGRMFESTGLYGESTLREVDPLTGEVLRSVALSPDQFGEGLARVGDRLVQLTWREQVAHVYHRDTFETLGRFTYSGEGWGLVHDGERLIMSDGSARLQFRSTETFDRLSSVTVTLEGNPLPNLNELEFVDGFVYANVYMTRRIVKIDPASGRVTATIDASDLDPGVPLARDEVLNGIAYDPLDGTFFLTGKRWPKMYRVRFVPK